MFMQVHLICRLSSPVSANSKHLSPSLMIASTLPPTTTTTNPPPIGGGVVDATNAARGKYNNSSSVYIVNSGTNVGVDMSANSLQQ